MSDGIAWTAEQRGRSDEVARALGERLRHTGPKLTIILGKNVAETADFYRYVPEQFNGLRFYPEVQRAMLQHGEMFVGLHPDKFVPQTIDHIVTRLCNGKHAELWTMSEYLVSWIAQAVGDNKILYQCVEVRLYEDDNTKYRAFGISRDGTLCNIGYGDWPFGWFMPSC